MAQDLFLMEHKFKCSICGNSFSLVNITIQNYSWKIGNKTDPRPVCSYKCMRTWEKAREEKKRA
jgi:DNA-directed RNA polymerase subunit RPC12/RpoP